ncbi:hypothetical protein [Streptococcus sp. HMSC10A01]|nr:hypothetical protein [Streptococcus sp. HMSC10A01]
MKIAKTVALIFVVLLIVVLFPLNPYLSVLLALISFGTLFLIVRK